MAKPKLSLYQRTLGKAIGRGRGIPGKRLSVAAVKLAKQIKPNLKRHPFFDGENVVISMPAKEFFGMTSIRIYDASTGIIKKWIFESKKRKITNLCDREGKIIDTQTEKGGRTPKKILEEFSQRIEDYKKKKEKN